MAGGLVTHEQEAATGPSAVLGATVDGTRRETRLTPKRRWRVKMAVRYALSRRAVPGWGWEILLGHLTFCLLVNRDALAVFRDIYKFIEVNYDRCVPLWLGARGEMEAALGLLPLMQASWRRDWSPFVYATDSSEYGYGACESKWPLDAVRRHGRVTERSRFRRLHGRGPR